METESPGEKLPSTTAARELKVPTELEKSLSLLLRTGNMNEADFNSLADLQRFEGLPEALGKVAVEIISRSGRWTLEYPDTPGRSTYRRVGETSQSLYVKASDEAVRAHLMKSKKCYLDVKTLTG